MSLHYFIAVFYQEHPIVIQQRIHVSPQLSCRACYPPPNKCSTWTTPVWTVVSAQLFYTWKSIKHFIFFQQEDRWIMFSSFFKILLLCSSFTTFGLSPSCDFYRVWETQRRTLTQFTVEMWNETLSNASCELSYWMFQRQKGSFMEN